MRELFCRVAGVSFEGRQEIIKQVNEGDAVELVPDPANVYDKNAIKVMHNNNQIGFVPADRAVEIKKVIMHENYTTVVNGKGSPGRGKLVGVRISITIEE